MRKEATTQMVEQTVVKWIAYDGEEFDDEGMCLDYERQLMIEAFDDIPRAESCGEEMMYAICNPAYDDNIYAIYIDTEETRNLVNAWADSVLSSGVEKGKIGTVQVFCMWDGYEGCHLGSTGEIKKIFCDFIDDLEKKAIEARLKYNDELLRAREENKA